MKIQKLNFSDQRGRIFTQNLFSIDFHQRRLNNVCAFMNENNSTYLKFWVGGKKNFLFLTHLKSGKSIIYLRSGLKTFL